MVKWNFGNYREFHQKEKKDVKEGSLLVRDFLLHGAGKETQMDPYFQKGRSRTDWIAFRDRMREL